MGLTSCVHTGIINETTGFCILVQLLPRLIYHTDHQLLDLMEHHKTKREPMTTITLSLLIGTGIIAGTGMGTMALIQVQHYSTLRISLDNDLKRIENSITLLQYSHSSLAEVALQNHKDLDLLFLQRGGLCVALREECLFLS